VHLVSPSPEHLEGYLAALERGWSPDTQRGAEAAREEIARVRADPALALAQFSDTDPQGRTVTLPDGSTVPRLPGLTRWMWDGEFCGAIGLRWQPGSPDLPAYCLGHIGYAVVGWKQRRGYATAALRELLPLARAQGLPYVEITTDPDNVGSQRVIEANGGVLLERFTKPASSGSGEGLRYRVALHDPLDER
jgi:predicted acetyltransferase